jgi:hypothetical protein
MNRLSGYPDSRDKEQKNNSKIFRITVAYFGKLN